MGLKKSDVLKDPVVTETIKSLEDIGCTAPVEGDLDRPPMLRMMIETDNLDSETAAILVAGKMTRGKFPEDYMPAIREDLGTTLWILQDPVNKEDPARIYEELLADGSGPALKIAMAAVTARGTGPEFEALKSTMSQAELVQHANEIAEVATQLTSQVGENLRWSPQAQPALEALYASVSTLSELCDSRDAREFRETVREFKQQAGIKDDAKPAALPKPEAVYDGGMRTSHTKRMPPVTASPMSADRTPKPASPSAGGLRAEDIMDDPLVKETVAAIEALGIGGGGRGRRSSRPDIDGHPVIEMLSDMGALDSVTAAVLVAETMAAGMVDPAELSYSVPAEVGDVLRLLGGAEAGGGLLGGGFDSGNVSMAKLGMAAIAQMLTGPEIRELERLDPAERQMAMMEVGMVGFAAVDLAESLTEHKLFDKIPAPLVERFSEGLENLARLSASKSQKRFFNEASVNLKTGMLKANSKDIAEPKPPTGDAGPAPDAPDAPDTPKGPSSGSFKF